MKIIDKQINVKKLGDKYSEFSIVPIGDIHFNSVSFDEESWNKFLERIKEIPNPLFIILGDITDEDRPSTRDRRSNMFLDRLTEYRMEDKKYIENFLKTMEKRLYFINENNCLGIMDGDHYRVFSNGKTSTELLCKYFNVPYLGKTQAIIRIIFKFQFSSRVFAIHARHGKGYQSTVGGKINANRKFVDFWEGIDLFVKAHSHSSWEDEIVRNIFTKEGFLYEKKIGTINCCSFKKSFVYAEEKQSYLDKIKNMIKEEKDEKKIKELLKFAGVIDDDSDYQERREYPPVNKSIIFMKLKIVKTRAIKGYPDYHIIRDIIKLDL